MGLRRGARATTTRRMCMAARIRTTVRIYPTYASMAPLAQSMDRCVSRGAVAHGPYGGAGVGQRYNPRTGTYSRGAVAYGPYGARGAASAYNPRTGACEDPPGSNVYGVGGRPASPAAINGRLPRAIRAT